MSCGHLHRGPLIQKTIITTAAGEQMVRQFQLPVHSLSPFSLRGNRALQGGNFKPLFSFGGMNLLGVSLVHSATFYDEVHFTGQ